MFPLNPYFPPLSGATPASATRLTLDVGEQDIDALARIAKAEAGALGIPGMKAVVQNVLNRRAMGNWGKDTAGVLNAKNQYSPIGGPKGVGSWDKLPAADDIRPLVRQWVQEIEEGKDDPTKAGSHFLSLIHI